MGHQDRRSSDHALNADSYKELVKQSVPKDKPVYRLDDPELFLEHRDPADRAGAGAGD